MFYSLREAVIDVLFPLLPSQSRAPKVYGQSLSLLQTIVYLARHHHPSALSKELVETSLDQSFAFFRRAHIYLRKPSTAAAPTASW
jgi:hypothetical protein